MTDAPRAQAKTSAWDLGPYAAGVVALLLLSKGFDLAEVERYLQENSLYGAGELVLADPDKRTAGQRAKANRDALALLRSATCCTKEERRVLRRYSGWGGLSLDDLPRDLGAVRPEELLATYYTPTRLTFDVCVALRPLLLRLRETVGRVLDCLEPSAGVGRFLQPFGPEIALGWQSWTAFERDPMSSAVLAKLFPRVNVISDIFETLRPWRPDFDLVLSNPPYGVRGAVQPIDREGMAFATAQEYFVRKALALLRPFGIGVFLVPAGLMTGTSAENKMFREAMLTQARLLTACRLPNNLFPGANLMTDLIIVRRREREGMDADDGTINAGNWFAQHGDLILGEVGRGKFGAEAVKGDFTGLPRALWKRPDLAVGRTAVVVASGGASAMAAARSSTRTLADRALAMRSTAIWDGLQELMADLEAFEARASDVLEDADVARNLAVVRDTAAVAEANLARAREQQHRPDDLAGIARALIHERGFATAQDVAALNGRIGGRQTDPARVEARLVSADEFGLEFTADGVLLEPPESFWAGDLYRHVDALERNTDPRAIALRSRVIDKIKPATFEEIPVPTPRSPWLPLSVLSKWIQQREGVAYPLPLVRTAVGLRSLHPRADSTVGWLTGDGDLWGVAVDDREAQDAALIAAWKSWWPTMPADLRGHVTDVYNRKMRGVAAPARKTKSLRLARLKIDLKPHQIEAVNALGPRGLLALDVGLGKTFTGSALLARARQQGWARRAVVVVPPSLVGNWIRELERALPDMAYAIVGYNTTRSGKLVNDDAPSRRDKWLGLVAGEYDFLLASEPAVLRLQVTRPPQEVLDHPLVTSAVLEWAAGRRRTERQSVVDDAMKQQWLAMMQRPIHEPDAITWDDVQPGLLVVDEAHHMRKAFPPAPMFGAVPDYAGNSATSRTAFQLWLRCVQVQHVYLLSATPVVNGPVELLTLLTAVAPALFRRMNAQTIGEWMAMFLEVGIRPREKMSGSTFRTAVVGLNNLDTLRSLMAPVAVFMTAPETLGEKSEANPGGLPAVQSRTLLVQADLPTQQATEEIVQFIEDAVAEEAFSQIGALLTALRKVAVHPQLYLQGELVKDDEGKVLRRKLPQEPTMPPPELLPTPKLRRLVENLRTMPTCGHLVFAESVVAHPWIAAFLESEGFAVKVLNAEVAPTPDKRHTIAATFNAGDVQVLIGNRVMMEGINVQRHGCVVHHLDTPWSPSDLHQRNGRVVRQFSAFDQVLIFYYAIEGGADVLMLQAVAGKSGWIQTIIGASDATTNPAATADVDPYLLLARLSKNPAMWTRVYEDKERVRKIREREARAKENVVRARAFLKLMQTCGTDRDRCRREAEAMLPGIDPKVVRLDRLREAAERPGAWVTSFGDIWWPGGWVMVEQNDEEATAYQLGRHEHARVGVRRRGQRLWTSFESSWLLDSERRSVRPISPPSEVLEGLPSDVVLNSGVTAALNWHEADPEWLRQHWDPSVVLEAIKRQPEALQYRAPFLVDGSFQLLPVKADVQHPLVPIYEADKFAASPAVLAEAARAVANNYFAVQLPADGQLVPRWVETVLFAYLDANPAADLEKALGVIGATRVPAWVRSEGGGRARMALVADARRVLDETQPSASGRSLRNGECSPLAGTRLRGQLLELLGTERTKPLGLTAPGETLDELGRRAAFGSTVAAWWPQVSQFFLRSGLAVRVLEEPGTRRLAVALLRSPEPDLNARGQLLACVFIGDVEEAQLAGEILARELPASLIPELEEATAEPDDLGGALASLDIVGERNRPVFLDLDGGALALAKQVGAWTLSVNVRTFRFVKPSVLRRRYVVTTSAVANLVGDDARKFLVGPATWSSATFTTGATVSDRPSTTRVVVDLAVRFRDFRGLMQSFTAELASQGLVLHGKDLHVFVRQAVPFVAPGSAWMAVSETAGLFGQFFGPVRVGLESAEGDDETQVVLDDGRFVAKRVASSNQRPTIWPELPEATVRVPVDKFKAALKHLRKQPATLVADGMSLRVIPADEQQGEVKIEGKGTGRWSLALRAPEPLRRALEELAAADNHVVTEEGDQAVVEEVTVGTASSTLWVSFRGLEFIA